MITTSVVKIHYHTQYKIFFLVMKTFKIYSLNNFQICNAVLLTWVAMLHMTYLFSTWKLYLFTPFFLTLYPCLWQPPVSCLYLWGWHFVLFLDFTYKWDQITFFIFWLISLSAMPSIPSMLLQMARFHSSLWLGDIPLCIYTTFSLSIHPLLVT